jgi:hypothetical protein
MKPEGVAEADYQASIRKATLAFEAFPESYPIEFTDGKGHTWSFWPDDVLRDAEPPGIQDVRERSEGFRRRLLNLRERWKAALDRGESGDEADRPRSIELCHLITDYDPDWHYFTLGEQCILRDQMKAAGHGVFNGCTDAWLREVYGPTVERDSVVQAWRMPYADWIRHEAKRLEVTA